MTASLDLQDIRRKIFRGPFDDVTKVYLLKIIEGEPSKSELYLVSTLISWSERYKIQQVKIDTLMKKQA